MLGEALLADDDGSGNIRDWELWGAEVGGLGETPVTRTYIARPLGRTGLGGASLRFRTVDIGELTMRLDETG
jgi:hypothetical protein